MSLIFRLSQIVRVDDRIVAEALNSLDGEDLAMVLFNAPTYVRAKLYGNMSGRRAKEIREYMLIKSSAFISPRVKTAEKKVIETINKKILEYLSREQG